MASLISPDRSRCSCSKVSSLARSPPDRFGFNITRTATPEVCRSITACTSDGSVNVNCLINNDFWADPRNSRTGAAPSSGWTITRGELGSISAGC